MPLTHLRHGVSASSTTALINASAGDGDFDGKNLYLQGVAVGETALAVHTFGSVSAVEIAYIRAPFEGNLISVAVVNDTSARIATYTVRAGSGGTVHVSSESNNAGVAGFISELAIDSAAVTTASGISVARGVQGTTGGTSIHLVFQRTTTV